MSSAREHASDESLTPRRGFLFRASRWLAATIIFLIQLVLLTWASLAIYYSNFPWAGLRPVLAVAFAAFAIWALWLSRRRRVKWIFLALVCGRRWVVAQHFSVA